MFIHSSIFTRIILDQCGLDRSPIRKYESYLGYMRAHFGCAVISLPPVILFNIIYMCHIIALLNVCSTTSSFL